MPEFGQAFNICDKKFRLQDIMVGRIFESVPSPILLLILSYFERPSHFLHSCVLNKAVLERFKNETVQDFWMPLSKAFGLDRMLHNEYEKAKEIMTKYISTVSKEQTNPQNIIVLIEAEERKIVNPLQLFLIAYRPSYTREIDGLCSKVNRILDPELNKECGFFNQRNSHKLYYSNGEIDLACQLLKEYKNGMNKSLVKKFRSTPARISISCSGGGPSSYLTIDDIDFFLQMIFAGAVPLVKTLIHISPHDTIFGKLTKPVRVSSGVSSHTQYNQWNGDDMGPRPSHFESHTTTPGRTSVSEDCYTVFSFIEALGKAFLIEKKEEIKECLSYLQIIQKQIEEDEASRKPPVPIHNENNSFSPSASLNNVELMTKWCDEVNQRKENDREVFTKLKKLFSVEQTGDEPIAESDAKELTEIELQEKIKVEEDSLSVKLQYHDHLHRLYTSMLHENIPLIARTKLHIEIPRIYFTETMHQTEWLNVDSICRTLHREMDELYEYLAIGLELPCRWEIRYDIHHQTHEDQRGKKQHQARVKEYSVDAQSPLRQEVYPLIIFEKRRSIQEIEGYLSKFMKAYVHCQQCKGYETRKDIISCPSSKKSYLYSITCQLCDATRVMSWKGNKSSNGHQIGIQDALRKESVANNNTGLYPQ